MCLPCRNALLLYIRCGCMFLPCSVHLSLLSSDQNLQKKVYGRWLWMWPTMASWLKEALQTTGPHRGSSELKLFWESCCSLRLVANVNYYFAAYSGADNNAVAGWVCTTLRHSGSGAAIHEPDTFVWGLTVDGSYSVASAYGAMFFGSSVMLGAK